MLERLYHLASEQRAILNALLDRDGKPSFDSVTAALNVLTYVAQAEKCNTHLLEHRLDKLDADVLELSMLLDEAVKKIVEDYLASRLDSKGDEC